MNTNGAPTVVSSDTSVLLTMGSVVRSGAFSGNVVYTSRRSIVILRDVCSTIGARFTGHNYCFLGPSRARGIEGAVVVGNTLGTGVINRPTRGVTRLSNMAMPGNAGVLVNRIRDMRLSRRFTRRGLSPMLTVCGIGSFRRTLYGTRILITSNNCNRASSICLGRIARGRGLTTFNTHVGAYHVLIGAPSSRNNVNSLCGFGLTPSLALNYNS